MSATVRVELQGTKLRQANLLAVPALCALFMFAAVTLASGAEKPRAKRVLIVSTGSRLSPGFALIDQGVLKALEKLPSGQVETYGENIDILRFPGERFQRIFTEYLTAKYTAQPPDLIVLAFVGSLRIAGELLHQLFPGTPVIVAGATEEEVRAEQFRGPLTGLASRADPRRTLELIFLLQPETRRVIVIGGTAEVDRDVLDRAKEAARSFPGPVEFEFWDNHSIAELRQAVTALPPRTAILFSRMFRDGAGQAVISTEVGRSIAQWANVPVYVMTDTALGTGAVGGSVASIEAIGKRAGEMARLVLSGTAPESLPLENNTGRVPTFDWRALQRWGIPESRLPPGSVVRFKPQSMWEQYRWYIIAALIIIGLQAAMIGDLLLQRWRRRRVEAELRENRQLMELAASAGELGLWSRDLKERDLWANAPMRSLFGFGAEDALRFDDIVARIHPDDRSRMLSEVEAAQTAGLPFERELRIHTPNGTERWVLAKGRTIIEPPDSAGRRVGVVLDITERKQAEEKLRESEDRFRAMANAAPVMIWMAGTDKLYTFFNKGWLDFTGGTLQELLGNAWRKGVHAEDFNRCLEVYANAFDARQEFTMEYRLRRYDGEYRWILDHGTPRVEADDVFLGYIGTAVDISDRKRAEEALDRERRFLRQVIDTDPNFIFAKDREGRFTLANQAVADAYGTTVDDLVGKTDSDFNPNREEVESFRQMDLEVMDRLQERFIPEERVTDAHGYVRWLQTVKRPIFEKDGFANQVLGASTDITQRRKAEIELQEQRAELAHVARISTMGELSASLAHELNQPLTAILSNAQAALRFISSKPVDLEEVREILQDIVKDNSRAGEVIRRMRALVKKEPLEFASLDLANLIRDVVVLLHSDAILQHVKIALELDENLPPVRGDRVQLQQVVLNLLLNAFDAMKECPASAREVKLQSERNDAGLIQVAVSDRGSGLTGDKLDQIFKPFYTTKGEGLGMGLSICRSIIEAHRGQLWAENNADGGATFYFTVPLVE
jgi:two-component system, LuxR family, sensor kinase FixL